MLFQQTVERQTLELLKKLQSEPLLQSFSLAGGTALALYMGHRMSEDLDLFTTENFNAQAVRDFLMKKYNFTPSYLHSNTLKGMIDGVKIDCITYSYDTIEPLAVMEDVRLYSLADIIAMKLSAISDNGTRLKDFVDIAFLSTKYSFNTMLSFYEKKFPKSTLLGPTKGLTYFDDIVFDEGVVMLEGSFDWKIIEKRLKEMVVHPSELFQSPPAMRIAPKPQKKSNKNGHKR